MSHVAVIVGLSGAEFFLDHDGALTEQRKDAKRFRTEGGALAAGDRHLDVVGRDFGSSVARQMSRRAEPADRADLLAEGA